MNLEFRTKRLHTASYLIAASVLEFLRAEMSSCRYTHRTRKLLASGFQQRRSLQQPGAVRGTVVTSDSSSPDVVVPASGSNALVSGFTYAVNVSALTGGPCDIWVTIN